MVTYSEYLQGILEKIITSHTVLSDLGDVPGDLDVMRIELAKIRGFLNVISNKIDASKYPSLDITRLQSKCRSYLESYSFEKEMERISMLYADDSGRLKNMRLAVLDSLHDKKLIEHIITLAK